MKNRISILRNELGLSIFELSKKLKINSSTVLRYEQGTINPPPDKLKIIADIFDCSIDYILYLSDDRKLISNENNNELNILLETNPATKNIFIERLKDIMINKEITKEQLSNTTKLDKKQITMFITGEQFPTIDILKELAKQLNTTIDYLVGLNENSSPDEIVILEDWVEIKEGEEHKKISAKDIRDFLKSISEEEKS
jgi:transcriptional regulator with XRE-family HTH domain